MSVNSTVAGTRFRGLYIAVRTSSRSSGTFEIPIATYYKQAMSFATLGDFMGGLAKAVVFGVLIAGIGCLRGLQTETGASAVGIAATSAVVSGIIMIVFVDGVFAVVYYYLGI